MKKKGFKDSKVQDNINELMVEGVKESLATATAIDIARKAYKPNKRVKPETNFYETPWNVEKQTGRVSSGRALLQKKRKPKMRHGQY